jgi:hypothetical protein
VWLTRHQALHWAWWACHARHCCSSTDTDGGNSGNSRPASASTKHFTIAALVGWLVHIAVTSAAITPVDIIAAAAAISALIIGSPVCVGTIPDVNPALSRVCTMLEY